MRGGLVSGNTIPRRHLAQSPGAISRNTLVIDQGTAHHGPRYVGEIRRHGLLVGGLLHRGAAHQQGGDGELSHLGMGAVGGKGANVLEIDQLAPAGQNGGQFRVFISYGVIAMSLAMYAWKKAPKAKDGKSLRLSSNSNKAA